ncbi:ABC transporter substrate-binding protein [Natronococcus sp. A-GB7]|uniref:ABC transporter substrate-binding protein n=1 Tax=Natronococcus sp. A-GB7 TaxID=3037649 RepID=UPI00241D963B|nr:ABC transporter substrate-binding protein [Natronococcus sp. A-GB7]MDG5820213.1 ABC transporter substrate-binding protein [Natronococcus sp. A-GB7]
MDNNHQNTGRLSRRGFVAGGTVASVGVIAGCTGDSGDLDDNTYSGDVTVTHWPDLMYNAPYHVALEQEYFAENGLDIEVVGSEGGGTTVRNVVDGGLPFGEVATPAAINGYLAGSPIVAVAGGTQRVNELNWVAPSGSDIESMADLEGGTIGYVGAGSVTETTSSLAVAASDELDSADVEFQDLGGVGEGLTAVEDGAVDVAANMDPTFSDQQADDEPWQVVFWAGDYLDQYQQTVIIADPEIVEDHPDVVESYLAARAQGIDDLRTDLDEAAEIFSEGTEGFSTDVMRNALETVDPDEYYSSGAFDAEGLRLVEEAMYITDLLDDEEEIEWEEIFDQSFVAEDERIDFDDI